MSKKNSPHILGRTRAIYDRVTQSKLPQSYYSNFSEEKQWVILKSVDAAGRIWTLVKPVIVKKSESRCKKCMKTTYRRRTMDNIHLTGYVPDEIERMKQEWGVDIA